MHFRRLLATDKHQAHEAKTNWEIVLIHEALDILCNSVFMAHVRKSTSSPRRPPSSSPSWKPWCHSHMDTWLLGRLVLPCCYHDVFTVSDFKLQDLHPMSCRLAPHLSAATVMTPEYWMLQVFSSFKFVQGRTGCQWVARRDAAA